MTNYGEKKWEAVRTALTGTAVAATLATVLTAALTVSVPGVAQFVLASEEGETTVAPSETGEATPQTEGDPTPTTPEETPTATGTEPTGTEPTGTEPTADGTETGTEPTGTEPTADGTETGTVEGETTVDAGEDAPTIVATEEVVASDEPASDPSDPGEVVESRTVELPQSEDQAATVSVSVWQNGDGTVDLVFVGYEDVILGWRNPAEALISMTVHRYPQSVLLRRHGVPVEVSDPIVQAAADEVRAFFDPSANGSLDTGESVADGRTVRVVFNGGTIDVIFLGGWEGAAFYGYDSVSRAMSDLADGGYAERIITSRFGASVEEVREALATARELVSAG